MDLLQTRLEMLKISDEITEEMDLLFQRIRSAGSEADVLYNLKKLKYFLELFNKDLANSIMNEKCTLKN